MNSASVAPALLERIVCPRDGSSLREDGAWLVCQKSADHRYPVVCGIPVLLRDDVPQTLWVIEQSWKRAVDHANGRGEQGPNPYYLDTLGIDDDERRQVAALIEKGQLDPDPVVQLIVAATSGNLYKPLMGQLNVYPIPDIRLPQSQGEVLLDIGCNWGRWSAAAAQKGYNVIGIDPSLGALLAARRVLSRLGVEASFVCGDGRHLPFADRAFDVVFSFGVIQHFSKEDARTTIASIARVLSDRGKCLVQMPNKYGIRSAYILARRAFREGSGFDVRYWDPFELVRAFNAIGPTTLSVDGFFGLGIQGQDKELLPLHYQAIVSASEALRYLSYRLPFITYAADSVYLHSTRA